MTPWGPVEDSSPDQRMSAELRTSTTHKESGGAVAFSFQNGPRQGAGHMEGSACKAPHQTLCEFRVGPAYHFTKGKESGGGAECIILTTSRKEDQRKRGPSAQQSRYLTKGTNNDSTAPSSFWPWIG